MNKLWKYFKCNRCGKCCRIGLPYDAKRISLMADYLQMSIEEVIVNYYGEYLNDGSRKWRSNDKKRIPCPFLSYDDQIAVCDIYSVRPEGCIIYPMETEHGLNCEAWEAAISKLKREQEDEGF